jgi:NADPH-dependent 2,4-dienoyl-CoA reductase/sulfur reductase-like enzyme
MSGIEESVNWVQKIVVKHSRYIKYGNVVIGSAREITPDRVILEDKTVFYDYLIIATGMLYGANMKDKNNNRDFRAASLSKEATEVKLADAVLVVGGGPVGVELVAEVCGNFLFFGSLIQFHATRV